MSTHFPRIFAKCSEGEGERRTYLCRRVQRSTPYQKAECDMMCAVSSKMLLVAAFLVIFFCALIVRFATGPKGPTLPPGPSRVPIIGSIPFVPREFRIKGRGLHTPKLFHYLARTYGPVCHIWLGPVPTIILSDAKLLREAFKSNSITSRPIMKPFHEFRYGSDVRSHANLPVFSSSSSSSRQEKMHFQGQLGKNWACCSSCR